MDKYELSPEQAKILAGMDKVYETSLHSRRKLIASW